MHDTYATRSSNTSKGTKTNPAQFSHHTSISRSVRRPALHASRLSSIQQTRSLSLFGWGSSKTADTLPQVQSPSTSPSPAVDSTAPLPTVEPIRTVKASHATADSPDTAGSSSVEPDALQTLENSVLQTQNTNAAAAASDTADLASIPEGIGYLKDVCGLDFGWGPTSLMQFLLEHIHITAGLSWSASIIAVVFLLRASIYPFAVTASDMTARFQEMSPMIKQIQARSREALNNNDRTGVLEAQMQMRELKKEGKFAFNKMFRPLLLQFPLGYGAWNLLRSCSNVPVPAFETETWLWLSNLTVGDPYYVLPIVTAAMTWVNVTTSAKTQNAQADMPGMALIRNVFPVITGVFMLFQPAAVQIYFLCNGLFTQIQVTSLQNPAWRRLLKLHPLPNQGPKTAGIPPSRMNISPRVINTTGRVTTTPAPAPEPASTSAEPTNRSFIDKGVDSIKAASQQTWRKAMGSTKEKAEQKAQERKRQAQKDAAARYEAQRRQDLENIRAYRNAAQTGQNGSHKQ
ncbi:putative mitochondrial export translocase Oxa1 [Cladophialophora carrionii]|uniref:Putative mitochondrial export translocase Oxa1 n=1 Tax=Cladophialophora carrionii TaxID=86049 RepID=A0A1C1CBH4_9EURO|nr:putative mitochondrial export translocase Oxa1 [Cladophialophora carrionii]